MDGVSSRRAAGDFEAVSASGSGAKEDDFGGRRININIGRVKTTKEVAEQEDIVKKFVKVQSSVSPGSRLNIKAKTRKGRPRSVQYWFDYKNKKVGNGSKSRMELSTCFIDRDIFNRLIETENKQYFREGSPLPPMFQVYSTAANQPIESVYTYEYKMKMIDENNDDQEEETNVILTQWHDSPDPRIIKYLGEAPVKVSTEQLYKLTDGKACTQGVLDRRSKLHYQQGGYPQLSLHLKRGMFTVTARSDERYFTPKGGVSHNVKNRQGADYPRQQIHTLLHKPKCELMEKWSTWKWAIRWSSYGLLRHSTTPDPGVLLSDAWICLWIDGEKVIDWTGPCGSNSQGRVPYFKIGFYNPSGSDADMKLIMKRYKQQQQHPDDLLSEERIKIESLGKGITGPELVSESEYNSSAMRKLLERHPSMFQ